MCASKEESERLTLAHPQVKTKHLSGLTFDRVSPPPGSGPVKVGEVKAGKAVYDAFVEAPTKASRAPEVQETASLVPLMPVQGGDLEFSEFPIAPNPARSLIGTMLRQHRPPFLGSSSSDGKSLSRLHR